MINYNSTIIYLLQCKDPLIEDRMAVHKRVVHNSRNKSHNNKVSKFIRENGGWINWEYKILEYYNNCNTKEEELRREKLYITIYKPSLNTRK